MSQSAHELRFDLGIWSNILLVTAKYLFTRITGNSVVTHYALSADNFVKVEPIKYYAAKIAMGNSIASG